MERVRAANTVDQTMMYFRSQHRLIRGRDVTWTRALQSESWRDTQYVPSVRVHLKRGFDVKGKVMMLVYLLTIDPCHYSPRDLTEWRGSKPVPAG